MGTCRLPTVVGPQLSPAPVSTANSQGWWRLKFNIWRTQVIHSCSELSFPAYNDSPVLLHYIWQMTTSHTHCFNTPIRLWLHLDSFHRMEQETTRDKHVMTWCISQFLKLFYNYEKMKKWFRAAYNVLSTHNDALYWVKPLVYLAQSSLLWLAAVSQDLGPRLPPMSQFKGICRDCESVEQSNIFTWHALSFATWWCHGKPRQ